VLDSLAYCTTLPLALGSLAGLQCLLCWNLAPCALLPTGPYLRSLQLLALPVRVAAANLSALEAAEQLRELELGWPRDQPLEASPPVLAVLHWAAHNTSLRRLCSGVGNRDVPPALHDAIVEAQREKPALHIHSSSELYAGLLEGPYSLDE